MEKERALARKRALFDQKFPSQLQNTNNDSASKKGVKWDHLITKDERDQAWNAGHSLDSKKITSALGYLDLKQICYCLA